MSSKIFGTACWPPSRSLALAVGASAQQPPSIGKQQFFPTPDAAADALNDAAKRGDSKALEAMLGAPWSALTPLQSDGFKRDLAAYFSAMGQAAQGDDRSGQQRRQGDRRGRHDRLDLAHPHRQGRHRVALQFRRRL